MVLRSVLSPYKVGRTGGGLGHSGIRAELGHDGGHNDLVRISVPGHLEEDAAVATHELQTEQARVGPVCQSKINLKPLLTELSITQIADES